MNRSWIIRKVIEKSGLVVNYPIHFLEFEKKFIDILKIELITSIQSITNFLYNEELDPGSG